jgi:hypothetical protein
VLRVVTGVAAFNLVLLVVGYCFLAPFLRGRSLLTWLTAAGIALLVGASVVGVALSAAAVAGYGARRSCGRGSDDSERRIACGPVGAERLAQPGDVFGTRSPWVDFSTRDHRLDGRCLRRRRDVWLDAVRGVPFFSVA